MERIAFFFPSMVDGGAERVTLNLIRYLAHHYNYPLDLVLVNASGAFMEQVPENVRVFDFKASRTLASMPKLIRYLREERPYVLLSGMDYVNCIALAGVKIAGTGTRTVACLHINMSAQLANFSSWRGRFITPFVKLTHPWADVIVGTSIGCGEDFVNVTGIGGKNMHYIYNPAITDDIKTMALEPVEHKWFVEGGPPVILAVGRLAHQKNFELLISALALLRKSHVAKLLILGNGDDRSKLESLVKKLDLEDHVDMPGFVSNPYAFMEKAAMYVLSSRYEALPAVLIEAMYCGTQLIATDCPSGPREILADGKYGQLIPVDDPIAMAAAMEKALMTKNFRQDVEACERFIDHNVIDQYLKVLLGSAYKL